MGARISIIHKVYVKSRHLSRGFTKKIEPILYPSAVSFEFCLVDTPQELSEVGLKLLYLTPIRFDSQKCFV